MANTTKHSSTTKQKNLLMIFDHMAISGTTTFHSGLINELLSHPNLTLHVVSFHETNYYLDRYFPESNRIHHYPLRLTAPYRIGSFPTRLRLMRQQLQSLSDINFSFVYTDLIYTTLAFHILKNFIPQFKGLPLIHHIHGSFTREMISQITNFRPLSRFEILKYKLFLLLERFTLRNCTKIFVNSRYSKTYTESTHSGIKTIINRPGIDPTLPAKIRTLTRRQARKLSGISDTAKVILFASRIEPRKGVIDFFKNLYQHKRLMENTKIYVCGRFSDNPFYHDLLLAIESAGIPGNIYLINSPTHEQLAILYRSADITVIPSTDLETFGFTTLESYYFKTPVAAFNIAANKELIPNSYLAKYNGPQSWFSLYKIIKKSLDGKLPQMDYNHPNFSWNNYVDSLFSAVNQQK